MANPKKRKTHSSSRQGRAHLALTKITLNKCPKCGHAVKPHTVCPSCGYYRGREVVKVTTKTVSKNKKK